ncbi:LIC10775 family protein [Leptospira santarosai]|uniref:HAD family hydrolase n=4 Tax=Leptospira santarosai TaxID=28183 RepID=M6VAS0_9LEPT|nr:hypothetical protein [Leptospira santarosai]EMO59966.1 hypothetical protein LEP1GSC161_0969 [Leptospira santarosai str. CBC1416]EKO33207.1 hypothetical protein LEP1GSC179_2745 [Leptospira santarosai str. MOR084]EKT85242.1 hypothetical protein LSS_18478 [Leptospira santarosai serovar Shermani str. LT 821]EMJ47935.1 hypothetical protein LEP1GSC169_0588 [Leptospira santarosai str. HAI1349]EMM87747.1 hypothetical protein LEP1GSC039_2554 [Leptospira santarosai str. 2000027870]
MWGTVREATQMYPKIRIFGFLGMLYYFFFTVVQIQSQTRETVDPLLRGAWYEDQEQKEAVLYNKVMRYFRRNSHFVWKTDLHGRNYRFYKDGRVEFLIDRDFREVFPDVSELDVHGSEAKALAEHGEPYSAIRLLKGIGLCYRFQFGKLVPEGYRNATEELSRLMRHMAHKRGEVDDLTDPYGCTKKNILKIESESFRFSLETTGEWKHYFPEPETPESGTEGDHVWKVRRYYQSIGEQEKNTTETKKNEPESKNGFSREEEWEKIYRSQSEKFLYYRPDRILFTIGLTYHPVAAVYNSKNYFQLWDLKRGINPRTVREMDFRRKKEENSYVSRFDYFHKDGRKVPMVFLEKYYLRENRGLLFTIAGPEKQIERIRQVWSQLNQKLIVE